MFCFGFNAFTQDSSKLKLTDKSIKLNFSFYMSWINSNISFGNVKPAFAMHFNDRIELDIVGTNFNFSKSTTGSSITLDPDTIKEATIGLAFQVYHYYFKKSGKKLSLYNSGSLSFNYFHRKINPPIQKNPVKVLLLNSTLAYVPGFKISLTENLFMDISFPINFFTIRFDYQRVYNPNFTLQQQETGGFGADLSLPITFESRLGIGLKL